MNRAEREAALDVLYDLQHDLGKHALLPLAMLPAEADDDAVRAALRTALRETRRGPSGVRSAAAIWADAADELSPVAPDVRARLRPAVESALRWEAAIDAPEAPDRAGARAAVERMRDAIRAEIAAVERDEGRT
jgi:hypothetical protein